MGLYNSRWYCWTVTHQGPNARTRLNAGATDGRLSGGPVQPRSAAVHGRRDRVQSGYSTAWGLNDRYPSEATVQTTCH